MKHDTSSEAYGCQQPGADSLSFSCISVFITICYHPSLTVYKIASIALYTLRHLAISGNNLERSLRASLGTFRLRDTQWCQVARLIHTGTRLGKRIPSADDSERECSYSPWSKLCT